MTLSSELVRSVLQSAPDAMIIIDGSGTILYANRQVTALFGYESAEVVGSPVEMLMPERFRGRHVAHRQGYTSSVRVRPMGAGLELFARRRDGREFPVEISLSPIQQQDEVLVAAAIRDVTDRARVEKELRDARATADRANLSKSRFLATASHDLRQPLQVLSLLNGTLRRFVDNEDVNEVLDQQEQALGTMSRLLNALLDISKLESGAIKPDICDFPVAQLLAELRLEYAGLAANKGLDFVVEATDIKARSDPTLVGQALKNLVANAIKYTSAGSVSLSARKVPQGVRIEVRDTGRGIAPEHVPFIFEEFYQVGVATNTSRDGYGLGLSIVQRVVRLLELRIDVSSRPGEGSTFALEMPASHATDSGATGSRSHRAAATAQGGNARHLLLVEDDNGVRNATRLFLKGEGYRVTAAASHSEALQLIQDHADIDLVISDYHLDGGRTGAEVIAAARERFGPGHPAILVTGDTTPAMASLKRDATLCLTSKPINADDLVCLIQGLLHA